MLPQPKVPTIAMPGCALVLSVASLRPPDPARRAGAKRGKRLSPELETGSPVAAVYDRRGTLRTLFGGHSPPLQNPVWAQRDSTGSGGLSRQRLGNGKLQCEKAETIAGRGDGRVSAQDAQSFLRFLRSERETAEMGGEERLHPVIKLHPIRVVVEAMAFAGAEKRFMRHTEFFQGRGELPRLRDINHVVFRAVGEKDRYVDLIDMGQRGDLVEVLAIAAEIVA